MVWVHIFVDRLVKMEYYNHMKNEKAITMNIIKLVVIKTIVFRCGPGRFGI